jgi:uncharacterized membrane protein YhaH (DUF805 family)
MAEEREGKTITVTAVPGKSIWACFTEAVEKAFAFNGRAGRREFWQFVFVAQALTSAISIVLGYGFTRSATLAVISSFIWWAFLGTILPLASLWARRAHDTGKSAWFCLVPVYNIILLFSPGTAGANKYGEDPNKPITKEVLAGSADANAALAKGSSLTEKVQIVGGTLLGVGGVGSYLYNGEVITAAMFNKITAYICMTGVGLLALSRVLAMLFKGRKTAGTPAATPRQLALERLSRRG